jgi:hypothetical protein
MNLAHLHLLLNHSPIIGTFIALGLFVVSLARNDDELKQVSLALFSLIALLAIPAYMTGYAAQETIKETAGVSMDLIQVHQGAALLAFISMEITGGFALLALWQFSRSVKDPWSSRPARWQLAAVLLFAIGTAAMMAIAGNTGGDIRHPEILADQQAAATMIGNAGSRLIDTTKSLVIDSSMWVWPILEDLHFIGLILLVAAIGAINLRVLGFLKELPVGPLHRFIPWGIAGFVINLITGMLFFVGMPPFYAVNLVFQLKMFTVMIAGANLVLFYCTSAFLGLERLGPGEDAPLSAKLVAAATIFLWFAIIILGRYIPFGEVT